MVQKPFVRKEKDLCSIETENEKACRQQKVLINHCN